MTGDGRAGAVAEVTTLKNPIRDGPAVMDRSKHVMMAGTGAERFAASQSLDIVDLRISIPIALQRVLAVDSAKAELDHG